MGSDLVHTKRKITRSHFPTPFSQDESHDARNGPMMSDFQAKLSGFRICGPNAQVTFAKLLQAFAMVPLIGSAFMCVIEIRPTVALAVLPYLVIMYVFISHYVFEGSDFSRRLFLGFCYLAFWLGTISILHFVNLRLFHTESVPFRRLDIISALMFWVAGLMFFTELAARGCGVYRNS
jgi:hypothetical protein